MTAKRQSRGSLPIGKFFSQAANRPRARRLLAAACVTWCAALPAAAAVLPSLAVNLVNHYTFDDPLRGEPLSTTELDLGLDATNIQLFNGAPRVLDGAWWGSQYALETSQKNTGPNDDWKAGVMFLSSAESTLSGTASVTGITIMGWFKPLGTIDDNPSPNTNTPDDPDDFYNAFGLAGLLRGDSLVGSLDGHAVRALIEVIDGKVTGLGRRRDSQSGNGSRKSLDDWYLVMPPGEWTHLAAAFNFDEGTIDLYKNGLPLAASDAVTESWNVTSGTNRTSNTAAGGIKIGGSYPDNSAEQNPFIGRIDELMFFNKWLSPEDMEAQFRLVSNIPGDYNRDGRVDAADYTVWRDTLGATGVGLAADGNDNHQIDSGDYLVWKDNFDTVAGAAALTGRSIPEPSSTAMALTIVAALLAGCRRRTLCGNRTASPARNDDGRSRRIRWHRDMPDTKKCILSQNKAAESLRCRHASEICRRRNVSRRGRRLAPDCRATHACDVGPVDESGIQLL